MMGEIEGLLLKLRSTRGESHHPAFVNNWLTIICRFLALHTLPLDEHSFKEMRTWGQTKISSYFILKTYWAESHLELFILLRLNSGVGEEHLSIPVSWIAARLSIARV